MTQIQAARDGQITPQMRRVAEREGVSPELVRDQVARGRMVIPANKNHLPPAGKLDPIAIGRAVSTKINANIGASPIKSTTPDELEKLRTAVKYGADTVMDLSTGGDPDECRRCLIAHATVPFGTVPIYQMVIGRNDRPKPIEALTYDDILREIEKQARQGVDFFTLHAGVLREHLPLVRGRLAGIVSRGGALLAKWMIHHNRQNPFYELFDEISAIMQEYDVTHSLGDGLRPGCLADASDKAQFAELETLGQLVHRARDMGVQAMVEGPGHIPFHQIEMNVKKQIELCDGAPFYVLGPIVTDAFPGYDHVTSAIGATAAAYHGAAFLCYVTPREHLGLPTVEDVKQGCVAYKIAAHAADVALGVGSARQRDDDLSRARAALDWHKQFELAFDPETARALHDQGFKDASDYCAMCGRDWCSVRISKSVQDWSAGKQQAAEAEQSSEQP